MGKKEMGKKEGWTWLANSTKWHYIRDGLSLCGKFLYLGNHELETGNNESPDNCTACKKAIAKQARLTERKE